MSYDVLLSEEPRASYAALDEKSQRIVRDKLQKLADAPYPGRGQGEKEKLPVEGEELYRLHIGRTYTAFYDIIEDDGEVRIIDVLTIKDAHDRYGY
jgi:mRNA-degrading endonuclease RelE of RelBE toxin-antitoxin system